MHDDGCPSSRPGHPPASPATANQVNKGDEPMPEAEWYYKERIENELERLGARTWRYQDDRGEFKDAQQAALADVELSWTR
jgi:hypothetical protein